MTAGAENDHAARGSTSDLRELRAPAERSESAQLADSLDELLRMMVQAPVTSGPEPVIAHVLDTARQLMPAHAFGACVVHPTDKRQLVVVRRVDRSGPPSPDPSRLFPEMEIEHTIPIAEVPGSTLHVASNAAPQDRAPPPLLVDRLVRCLGASVRTAFELDPDVTPASRDPRRLRAQLIQAEKLANLGRIVAGVVHELANPLTSIVAYADVLSKKAASRGAEADDVERLRRIEQAAARILKFSRDLVSYARPSSEALGPVSIHEVLDQAAEFCEHDFSAHEVELVRCFSVDTEPVSGRAGPLTQVFVNLFTNAAHAMAGRGGRLTVTTTVAPGESVSVEVMDSGIGIPPEALSHIFDPFFTTKEKGNGTGLGLAIVSDIIKAHRGTLDARSSAGEGTTFTITLPVYDVKSTPRPRGTKR